MRHPRKVNAPIGIEKELMDWANDPLSSANSEQTIQEALEGVLLGWQEFYKHLPNGEYKGLGLIRMAITHAENTLLAVRLSEENSNGYSAK